MLSTYHGEIILASVITTVVLISLIFLIFYLRNRSSSSNALFFPSRPPSSLDSPPPTPVSNTTTRNRRLASISLPVLNSTSSRMLDLESLTPAPQVRPIGASGGSSGRKMRQLIWGKNGRRRKESHSTSVSLGRGEIELVNSNSISIPMSRFSTISLYSDTHSPLPHGVSSSPSTSTSSTSPIDSNYGSELELISDRASIVTEEGNTSATIVRGDEAGEENQIIPRASEESMGSFENVDLGSPSSLYVTHSTIVPFSFYSVGDERERAVRSPPPSIPLPSLPPPIKIKLDFPPLPPTPPTTPPSSTTSHSAFPEIQINGTKVLITKTSVSHFEDSDSPLSQSKLKDYEEKRMSGGRELEGPKFGVEEMFV